MGVQRNEGLGEEQILWIQHKILRRSIQAPSDWIEHIQGINSSFSLGVFVVFKRPFPLTVPDSQSPGGKWPLRIIPEPPGLEGGQQKQERGKMGGNLFIFSGNS